MSLEDTGRDVGSLDGVRDNSLAENYTPHDYGQQYIEQRLQEAGFETIQLGDDERHSDTVQFSDGTPDVGILLDDELVAATDVKTKRYRDGDGEQWFRRLNQRHWNNYLMWQSREDVDVYLWFCLLEEDTGVIHRKGFIPVNDHDQVTDYLGEINGNEVVALRETDLRSLQSVAHSIRN